jgi:hypothetical protein
MRSAQVTFDSLWPSLRQTIIEQIRDDFTPNTYFDSYYPVWRILNLTKNVLYTIMAENSKVWDEIPRYYQEYRRKHPTAVIDPDEPPPPELVKVIRFLKQNSLPGSLLGDWQKVLPSTEVFRPPFMFPSQAFDSRRM